MKKTYIIPILAVFFFFSNSYKQSTYKESNNKPLLTFKLVSVWSRTNSIFQNGMKKFADDLSAVTKGELQIDFSSIGENPGIDSYDVFDKVSNGTIDMGFGNSIYWNYKDIPGSDFWYAVPFGLNAQGMHAWLYEGGGLKLWRDAYAKHNVIPFPIGNVGGAMAGWFRNKINTMDDFKGLKMHMAGFTLKVYEKLGAKPILDRNYNQISAAKALRIYQKGELDVIIGLGPYHDQKYKLFRGPKYYYYPGWQEPGGVLSLIINKGKWEGLEKHHQKAIEVVCENTYRFISTQFRRMNALKLQELQEVEGIEILPFPPAVLSKLRQVTRQVLEEEAENEQFKRIYDAFTKFKEENIDSGWGKILDDSVYSERFSKLLKQLNEITGVNARQEGNQSVVISLSSDTSFASGQAILKTVLYPVIKRIKQIINEYAISIKLIKIEGHTDSTGNDCTNWELSKYRADAVKNLLIQHGVKDSFIKVIPYGELNPTADNSTQKGRRMNRRVEIVIEF